MFQHNLHKLLKQKNEKDIIVKSVRILQIFKQLEILKELDKNSQSLLENFTKNKTNSTINGLTVVVLLLGSLIKTQQSMKILHFRGGETENIDYENEEFYLENEQKPQFLKIRNYFLKLMKKNKLLFVSLVICLGFFSVYLIDSLILKKFLRLSLYQMYQNFILELISFQLLKYQKKKQSF